MPNRASETLLGVDHHAVVSPGSYLLKVGFETMRNYVDNIQYYLEKSRSENRLKYRRDRIVDPLITGDAR